MNKHIENGRVAVIISNAHGSGWSTWASKEERLNQLFDSSIVWYLLYGSYEQLEQYIALRYPERSGYNVTALIVEWIDQGTEFVVDDYDGLETIRIKDKISWITA